MSVAVIPETPPADRPLLESPQELSPLAANWRKAVMFNRRQEVLQGALALRQAADGQAQLLLLARDQNEIIRAFATRELGRRLEPELSVVFERALEDESKYVRDNARWALAQLEQQR